MLVDWVVGSLGRLDAEEAHPAGMLLSSGHKALKCLMVDFATNSHRQAELANQQTPTKHTHTHTHTQTQHNHTHTHTNDTTQHEWFEFSASVPGYCFVAITFAS